jgi:tetratricopeptide (TPR) repeat protein
LPVNLSAMYPPPVLPAAASEWFFLFFAAATLLYGAWRISRGSEKGEASKAALISLGFFLITIFPALLVFPPADRYSYVPAAGLFFIYSFLVWRLYEIFVQSRVASCGAGSEMSRLKRFFTPARLLVAFVAVHCAVLGFAAFKRASVWRDSFSLYNDVLKKYPREPLAYSGRAGEYRAAGRYREAIDDFSRSIELRPDDWKALSNRAGTFARTGDFDRAIADYSAAISINPGSAQLILNRGNAYVLKGEYPAALRDYNRALAISPDFPAAAENKCIVLEKLK